MATEPALWSQSATRSLVQRLRAFLELSQGFPTPALGAQKAPHDPAQRLTALGQYIVRLSFSQRSQSAASSSFFLPPGQRIAQSVLQRKLAP